MLDAERKTNPFRAARGGAEVFTKIVLAQLDTERRQALIKEMAANRARHNRGDEKRTVVHSEYFEVHARRIE